jgi:hypothetical protein
MKGQREKPLGLDMPFDEALERFIGTVPSEVAESQKRAKERGPPERPPGVAKKPAKKASGDT